jgi:hypothetical protein
MASGVPPVPPAGGAQPAKKKSPLLYILIGCGGVVIFIGVLIVAAISFGLYKAKQAGLDPDLMKKNPALAMVKLAVAANPDAELVSIDEDRGVVTVRDKKTGKTVTMNFEDVKKGKISFEEEGGQKVSLEAQGEGSEGSLKIKSSEGSATIGAGGPVNLPSWLPAYPGAAPQGTFALQDKSGSSAGFQFTTKDAPAQVFQFFEAGLKKSGLTVDVSNTGNGGIVTARDANQEREAMITVSASGSGSQVSGTFKSKN